MERITIKELEQYTKVKDNAFPEYKWEIVLECNEDGSTLSQRVTPSGKSVDDVKYSRIAICREHKLQRELSIPEFYGNSTVD